MGGMHVTIRRQCSLCTFRDRIRQVLKRRRFDLTADIHELSSTEHWHRLGSVMASKSVAKWESSMSDIIPPGSTGIPAFRYDCVPIYSRYSKGCGQTTALSIPSGSNSYRNSYLCLKSTVPGIPASHVGGNRPWHSGMCGQQTRQLRRPIAGS